MKKYGQYRNIIEHSDVNADISNAKHTISWYKNEQGKEIQYLTKGFKLVTNDPEDYLSEEEVKGEWREITLDNLWKKRYNPKMRL